MHQECRVRRLRPTALMLPHCNLQWKQMFEWPKVVPPDRVCTPPTELLSHQEESRSVEEMSTRKEEEHVTNESLTDVRLIWNGVVIVAREETGGGTGNGNEIEADRTGVENEWVANEAL